MPSALSVVSNEISEPQIAQLSGIREEASIQSTDSAAGTSSFSSTATAHNRILNDGTSTYTYDAEGNRTSKTDIATGNKVEYQWNHANLLTGVIYKTSNNVVTTSVAYQYDALGRRIGKSVDDNGNGTVDRRESYIYLIGDLVTSTLLTSLVIHDLHED